LEKRGQATQLIVDGKPFLVLGGELSNTVSSDTERMGVAAARRQGPHEHHPDRRLVGLDRARGGEVRFPPGRSADRERPPGNVRIVWIWFGSWKNGLSSFAPAWVKAAQDRFPRAQIRGGKTIEVLSTLSQNNLQADARAFAALMRHTREVDRPTA
jgi:hypothetical protein